MPLSLLRPFVMTVATLGTTPLATAQPPGAPDLSEYRAQIDSWSDDIARLVAQPAPAEADVFLLGSSSIRLWETAAEDLKPYTVVRRGYGGARYSDLAFYVDRLAAGLRFRAAVVFVGNDIAGRPDDKTADEVSRLFGYVADRLKQSQPECIVICVDVRPTPSRFGAWNKIAAGNAALHEACESRPGVFYLETSDEFLDEQGAHVRDDLYSSDRLHLNEKGYRVWRSLIRAELDRRLASND